MVSFAVFKRLYRQKKAKMFRSRFLSKKRSNSANATLNIYDSFLFTKDPWEEAFARNNNEAAWRKTGIYPFSRCVQHRLKAKEVAKKLVNARFTYRHNNTPIMTVEEALVACLDQEEEEVDPSVEVAADAASLKVISTNMWKLGPVTTGVGIDMVRGQHVRQLATAEEKKRKAEDKTSAEDAKRVKLFVQGKAVIARLDANETQVDKLTVSDLDACLVVFGLTCKGKGLRAEKILSVSTWLQKVNSSAAQVS